MRQRRKKKETQQKILFLSFSKAFNVYWMKLIEVQCWFIVICMNRCKILGLRSGNCALIKWYIISNCDWEENNKKKAHIRTNSAERERERDQTDVWPKMVIYYGSRIERKFPPKPTIYRAVTIKQSERKKNQKFINSSINSVTTKVRRMTLNCDAII